MNTAHETHQADRADMRQQRERLGDTRGRQIEGGEGSRGDLRPDAVQLAIAAGAAILVGVFYLILSPPLTLVPQWLPLALVLSLLLSSLIAAVFLRRRFSHRVTRGLALGVLGVLTGTLVTSIFLLVLHIPTEQGFALLRDGAALWAMNVLVFAVWHWEFDGDGPQARLQAPSAPRDMLFPQQQRDNPAHWTPGFIDYLFLAFCFSTAFSPADSAPLSRRAKVLMMVQVLLALTIITLIVSRGVGILT